MLLQNGLTEDSDIEDTIHQNVSLTDASSYFSTRLDTRITLGRVSPLTVAVLIAAPRANTSTPSTLPARETGSSKIVSIGILRRCCLGLWRSCRDLDTVVPRLARSLALGSLVDA